jgi:hypothetical protein
VVKLITAKTPNNQRKSKLLLLQSNKLLLQNNKLLQLLNNLLLLLKLLLANSLLLKLHLLHLVANSQLQLLQKLLTSLSWFKELKGLAFAGPFFIVPLLSHIFVCAPSLSIASC